MVHELVKNFVDERIRFISTLIEFNTDSESNKKQNDILNSLVRIKKELDENGFFIDKWSKEFLQVYLIKLINDNKFLQEKTDSTIVEKPRELEALCEYKSKLREKEYELRNVLINI